MGHTLALKMKSASPESKDKVIAHKACGKASWTIFRRMVIDGATAVAYIFQGKANFFRCVVDAHKEFKKLRKGTDEAKVREFLEKSSSELKIEGIIKKRIIPHGVLSPKRMLSNLHDS